MKTERDFVSYTVGVYSIFNGLKDEGIMEISFVELLMCIADRFDSKEEHMDSYVNSINSLVEDGILRRSCYGSYSLA